MTFLGVHLSIIYSANIHWVRLIICQVLFLSSVLQNDGKDITCFFFKYSFLTIIFLDFKIQNSVNHQENNLIQPIKKHINSFINNTNGITDFLGDSQTASQPFQVKETNAIQGCDCIYYPRLLTNNYFGYMNIKVL